ncbi:MAG: hypothetical protein J7L73_09720, partial [Anaerolineales bacterium]|nr:hypothetical protein [Anaerolineales bacterium]
YYYGYRYYAPELQRWIGRDPVGEWDSVSLYVYVLNNPLLLVDPYGLRIRHWTDLIPDWMVSPKAVNFTAGMADYLSLGLTYYAREGYGINDVVDPCSKAYKWGMKAGVAYDVVTIGGSGVMRYTAARTAARLKNLGKLDSVLSGIYKRARKKMWNEIQSAAKRLGKEPSKIIVHHATPLRGHIGKGSTLFPTLGMPEWFRNARWNLVVTTWEEHKILHKNLRRLEIIGRWYGRAFPVRLYVFYESY